MNPYLNELLGPGYQEKDIGFHDHIKQQLDNFANNMDIKIQNELMRDIMVKYSELSNTLEEKNKMLKKYNSQLEEMVEEKIKDISDLQMSTIYAFVKLSESRDDETGAHIERTSGLCKLMAELMKDNKMYQYVVDDEFINNIHKASPLHDIGKVGIPDHILLKAGKLTEEEFAIMKTHVNIGYDTLKEVQNRFPNNSFLSMGLDIISCHHEKWDGSGYPYGLSGTDIALSGRIMAIADVYDALRSKRVYKDAFTHEVSCQIIKEKRGNHLDPYLVDIFIENHRKVEELDYELE